MSSLREKNTWGLGTQERLFGFVCNLDKLESDYIHISNKILWYKIVQTRITNQTFEHTFVPQLVANQIGKQEFVGNFDFDFWLSIELSSISHHSYFWANLTLMSL